jgi:thiol:disulfide interchange protein
MKMVFQFSLLLALLTLQAPAQSTEASPFTISPSLVSSNGARFLSLAIHVPEHHHIYADRLSFELNGASSAAALPVAKRVTDRFNGGEKMVFENDFQAALPWPGSGESTLTVNVQGCSDSECYFPETRQWKIKADQTIVALNIPDTGPSAQPIDGSLTNGFRIAACAAGFLSSEKFLGLLDQSRDRARNGWLGWSLSDFSRESPMRVLARSDSTHELQSALEQSRATGKSVVVDFRASWCQNCEAMEHSTFRDATVRQRLDRDFILVRFESENLNDPALKPALDQFGVVGLPTCVVLVPESKGSAQNQ